MEEPRMRTAAMIAALALMTTPVLAADPGFVGTWASSSKACKANPNVTGNAAFVIDRAAMYGNEWQCEIKNTVLTGEGGWRVGLACASEGDEYKRRVVWRLVGEKLHQVEGGKIATFTRCAMGDYRGHPKG